MNGNDVQTVEMAYDVYEASDSNPDKCPIIFVHGLYWNKYMLRELAQEMSAVTKRKVYCVDIRCHDQSPFREEFNFDIIPLDFIRFIQDRQLEKVAFVCHSFPCTVAYFVLLKKPEIVEKVVMIDHPPFLDYSMEGFYQAVYSQFEAQNKLLKFLDTSMSLSAAKRKIRNIASESAPARKRVFCEKAAYELIKVNNQFKWKTDHKFLTDKAKWLTETTKATGRSDHEILIIRSQDSPYVPDKKFEAVLKYNPNATLKTIPDSTHLLMFEKPEEFLEAVREFLL